MSIKNIAVQGSDACDVHVVVGIHSWNSPCLRTAYPAVQTPPPGRVTTTNEDHFIWELFERFGLNENNFVLRVDLNRLKLLYCRNKTEVPLECKL